ncbi:hypothetical protein [Olivibacter domesticus]|uniref:Uncharacterized protein n=1 Tax=Olivibacter domesticus TaxID=407022 RepID=A0A1H7R2B0_OLID1|nr:hypothetical protein [Olivibacter domesticus]SEL54229.1 hypothetical protein SAMN05661044_02806 [Olivibacter domesticus]
MEITTTTIHELNWDFPNAQDFNAEIINGKITKLILQDVGELTNSHLDSTNEKYLRHVHRALGGLFQHLDKIRGIGSLDHQEDEDAELKDEERNLRYLQRDESEMKEYKERVLNSINRS